MYTNKKIASALLGASIASRALKVISGLLLMVIMCASVSLWSAEWSADWDSLDGWDANSEEYCDLTHFLPVGAASESFGPCDSRDMHSGLKDPLLSSVNRNRGTKRNQDDEYFFTKRAPAPDGTFYPSAASLCPEQLTELFGGQQETSAQVQEETDCYQQEVSENVAGDTTVDGNVDVATAPRTAATRDQSLMGEQPLKCYRGGCSYVASDKKDLSAHRRTHSPDQLYECDFPGCGQTTPQLCNLNTHIRTHTGEKPFKCDFNECNYASPQASTLTRHKRKHTGKKPYECDFPGCTYTAARSDDVTKHRRTHTGEKPFVCGIDGCTYTTAQKGNLITHRKTHTGEKPFVSGVASKALLPSPQVQSPDLRPILPQQVPESSNPLDSNLSPLVVDPADWDTTNCVGTPDGLEVANDDHWLLDLIDFNNSLKANAGLRPDADEATVDGNVDVLIAPQTAATRDQSWMGEQPLKCYKGGCSYVASDKNYLRMHRKRHSPGEKYTCDFPGCGQTTPQLIHLTTHRRTHTGENPFKCDFNKCNYASAQAINLARHKKKHTGEKPFVCGIDECTYAAARPDNLNAHRSKMHTDKIPYECDVPGKALLPSSQTQSPNLCPMPPQRFPESSDSLDLNQVHSADLGATNCTGTPDGEAILWSLGVSPAK